MRQTGVERLVYSSTAAVYGASDVHIVSESHPARPISPYGYSKLAGEDRIRAAARSQPLRWAILRRRRSSRGRTFGLIETQHDPRIAQFDVRSRTSIRDGHGPVQSVLAALFFRCIASRLTVNLA